MNKTRGGNADSTDILGVGSCVNMKWPKPSLKHFASHPMEHVYNSHANTERLRESRHGMGNFVRTNHNGEIPPYVKTGSFTRFVQLVDQDRVYSDSQLSYGSLFNAGFVIERPGIPSSSFHIDNHNSNGRDGTTHIATSTEIYSGSRGRQVWARSSYGTLQTMNPLLGLERPIPQRPKYYFNMNHFGYYSDMLSQGRDSRCYYSRKGRYRGRLMVARGRTLRSPVRVQFVTGSVDDSSDIKSYYLTKRPNSMFFITQSNSTISTLFPFISTDDVIYTRGNVSRTSTSSFGFAEDGPLPGPSPAGGGAVSEGINYTLPASSLQSAQVPLNSWAPITTMEGESPCFMTTAICHILGYEDNCDELEILRGYRDEYMLSSPELVSYVKAYYNSAPSIVKRMWENSNRVEEAKYLKTTFINPAVEAIKSGDNILALKIYEEMMNSYDVYV